MPAFLAHFATCFSQEVGHAFDGDAVIAGFLRFALCPGCFVPLPPGATAQVALRIAVIGILCWYLAVIRAVIALLLGL